MSGDGLEHEILFEVLRCSRLLSLRLGLAISPIVYESIVGASTVSSEDIVPRLLNTMKCGYKASVTASNVSDLGADFLLKKEIAENKNLRKFTVDTLISIHALCEKASGWGGVLNAIERYLNLLVPRKPTENVDSNMLLDANVSIIVQATSQVAEIMFESALSILLFLNYILDISGQVNEAVHIHYTTSSYVDVNCSVDNGICFVSVVYNMNDRFSIMVNNQCKYMKIRHVYAKFHLYNRKAQQ